MKLQVLQDSSGNQIGVYVPMEDWTLIKQHYPDIEEISNEIPDWQKEIIDARLDDYYKNPTDVMDFDKMIDDIEKRIL